MAEIEDYFIDEEKIKQRIAGIHPTETKNVEVGSDANLKQETPVVVDIPVPTKIKVDKARTTRTKNSNKPLLDSFFENQVSNTRSRSRISIPSDLITRIKRVALNMEQRGKPHSINAYINNILLQHLADYENEINQLEDQ